VRRHAEALEEVVKVDARLEADKETEPRQRHLSQPLSRPQVYNARYEALQRSNQALENEG
jgi:hypothetical protein